MNILVLNAGSSSQKSCFYSTYSTSAATSSQPPPPLWEAQIDWTHQPGVAEVKIEANQAVVKKTLPAQPRLAVMEFLLSSLWSGETQVVAQASAIALVGHRVVHGGDRYREPTAITPEVKTAIQDLSVFAPVHNPANLEGIEAIEAILGSEIPQVAVFDTAFHSQLPPAAYTYPIPSAWQEQGIRRYGFHGISHQYCAQRAAQLLQRNLQELRLINCHLGNGCSLAAIRSGQSVDTTMGFTPLEGLMMGSRSGSIDPGILLHLIRTGQYTAENLDHALNKESGLLGVSGVSNDLRSVQTAIETGNSQAQLAIDVFLHRLRFYIGAMLPSLGGLDALIFTGGIGENAPHIRAAACSGFEFLGLAIDESCNQGRPVDQNIASATSAVQVLVIHTQEDWAIAQAALEVYD